MAIVQAPPTTLADVSPGFYLCKRVRARGQNAVRLKRLGVCEGRMVELVGRGDPMVLRIGGSQVGVSRQLARSVTVEAGRPETEFSAGQNGSATSAEF